MDSAPDPVPPLPAPRMVVVPPAGVVRVPDRLAAAYWLMARAPALPGVERLGVATRVYRAGWTVQPVAAVGGFLWLAVSPPALLLGGALGLVTLGATMAGADLGWEEHRRAWSLPLRAPRTTALVAAVLVILAATVPTTPPARGFVPWLVCLVVVSAADAWRGRLADRLVRELAAWDAGALRAMLLAGIVVAPPDAPLTARPAGPWPIVRRSREGVADARAGRPGRNAGDAGTGSHRRSR